MERIDKLKQFLVLNPADAFVQHALALEYVKAGDEGKAEKLFRVILEQDPSYTGSYYHLAKLLERSGRREDAIQCYIAGMDACKKHGDIHALRELQNAFEDLTY